MTGIIAAGNYSFTSAPAVQLHNQTIGVASFATATASYQIANDGKVRDQSGAILESWLTSGSASSYEVYATLTSGTLSSGTLTTWLNCGTSRTWSVVNSARDNSVISAVIVVQIRDVATHTVQATATISLSAESDNRN